MTARSFLAMSRSSTRDFLIPVIAALLLSIMIIIARPLGKMDRVWSDIALSSQKTPASSEYLIVDITLEDTKRFGGLPLSSCLLYTSPSPRDQRGSRMPSSA